MKIVKNVLLTLPLSSIFLAAGNVYAYAPVESRNFEQPTQYQESNVNSNAQFVDPGNQPIYTFDDPAPKQQLSAAIDNPEPGTLTQIQRLEQEIRELRGQLEVQEHAVKQLQEAQRSQYQDLDKRLAEKGTRPSESSKLATIDDDIKPTANKSEPKVAAKKSEAEKPTIEAVKTVSTKKSSTVEEPSKSAFEEQQAYQQAYNLLKSKQYSQAIPAMNAYLNTYPKGDRAADAHYWLGELYLLTGSSVDARKQFLSVVESFPSAAKVPDSLLKLAFIDADQGQYPRAKEQLSKVTKEYPNTPAARLAEQRLQQLALQGN